MSEFDAEEKKQPDVFKSADDNMYTVTDVGASEHEVNAWQTFRACVLSGLPYAPEVSEALGRRLDLDSVIQEDPDVFEAHVTCADKVDQAKEILAVTKLWFGKLYDMYIDMLLDEKVTAAMRRCLPCIIKVEDYSSPGWHCRGRLCPWCYMRKLIQISEALEDAEQYSVGCSIKGYKSNTQCERLTNGWNYLDFKKDGKKLRRLCHPHLAAELLYPNESYWVCHASVLVDRGDEREIRGVPILWHRPENKVQLMSELFPYPPGYISGSSRALADLLLETRKQKRIFITSLNLRSVKDILKS